MKRSRVSLVCNIVMTIGFVFILPLQLGAPFFPDWFRPYAMPLSSLIFAATFAFVLLVNKLMTGMFFPAKSQHKAKRATPRINRIIGIALIVFPFIVLTLYWLVHLFSYFILGRPFLDNMPNAVAVVAVAAFTSIMISDRLYDRIDARRAERMKQAENP